MLRLDKPFRAKARVLVLRVSAGALSGADVKEGKEISVEPPRGNLVLGSHAFALEGSPPGVPKVEISPRSVHHGS
jgi:hypothetical protein